MTRRRRTGLTERSFDYHAFGWEMANEEELRDVIAKCIRLARWPEDDALVERMRERLRSLETQKQE